MTAFKAGAPHAGADPLDNKVALEFADGSHDDHQGTAEAVRHTLRLRVTLYGRGKS